MRAFGDEEAEFVARFVQRVEAGELAMHAHHTVEREDAVLVGIGEEERARGEERGELGRNLPPC